MNRFFLRLRAKARDPRPFLRPELGPLAFANTPPELFEIHALAGARPELALTLSTYMEATLHWRTPRPGVTLAEAELRAIEAPVHFIWGADDAYGPPSIGEHAASLLPRARVEVRPGGHLPQLDDPRACAASIAAFLGERSQRS